MPIATLLPTGGGTQNQFTAFGGGRPSIVNTKDDGASHVWFARNVAKTDRIACENLPAGAGVVSLVQSTHRSQHTGAGTATHIKSGFYESAAYSYHAGAASSPGWTDTTQTVATAPGGGGWTPANVNSAEMALNQDGSSSQGNAVEITYYAGLVTYELGGGGFGFMVGLAGLLPAMGAFDLGQYLQYMRRWTVVHADRNTFLDGEIRKGWRELLEYRHPSFFQLGEVV